MLTNKSAIVDPRSGFVDVTGDGRQDALILVSTGGAAGAVALYVFSTHGQAAEQTDDQTSLKVVFRLQSLYGASLRISRHDAEHPRAALRQGRRPLLPARSCASATTRSTPRR